MIAVRKHPSASHYLTMPSTMDDHSMNARPRNCALAPFPGLILDLFFPAGQMVLMISLPQSTHSILNVMALFWLFHTRRRERKGDEERECKGGNEEIIRFRS